ncbi:hypothetical protein C0583_07000 [Candidatus Parcubacteria bacterium]|nr:MAG: hypothetical protein C0583_07000 [Candidatus Parcubacteria bacterium]
MIAFAFVLPNFNEQVKASVDYSGQLVKMEGLSSVYYVGADGKRYVFPDSKTYYSWFPDFDDVNTIPKEDLESMMLGVNVRYRPGVILIKITTNPKVYAVSQNGILHWVKNQTAAVALYGENCNQLVNDVADAFFTNYTIGDDIDYISDYDINGELENTDNIDANRGRANANALRARTRKCQIINNARDCSSYVSTSNSEEEEETTVDDDGIAQYINNITVSNQGQSGYIDTNDKIQVVFSEAIDPESINENLETGNFINSLNYNSTGAIQVYSDGLVVINNIASFDIGKVDEGGTFAVKLALDSSSKVLNITIISGNSVQILDEDFEEIDQIGGTIKDLSGDLMENDSNIDDADGTFGGVNVNDGVEPYISSIKVYNNGNDDYIDIDDQIKITFSEAIDPESVNDDLDEDASVSNVDASDTGGVTISTNGLLTIIDIASFYVGDVDDSGSFDVDLALDSSGKVLTITLVDGDQIGIENEDLDDASQIGDVIEDKDGNEMDDDPNIDDPLGSFGDESAGSELYISYIKAYDNGYSGYIDEGDQIVITFSQPIYDNYLNNVYAEWDELGGVSIDEDGVLLVSDILAFDIGEIKNAYEFETFLELSSDNKILTISLLADEPVKIISENFSNTVQYGGYILDEDQEITMETQYDIDDQSGTFGGASADSSPYIISIEVANGNEADMIDIEDEITITFSEAIDPDSINNDLELDDYVTGVDSDDTGGVEIDDDGYLTITDIANFYIGDVEDDTNFDVRLDINEIGNVLTITLKTGTEIEINYQDLDDASQTGGTLEDEDGDLMEEDPRIDDPEGSF